MICLRCGHCCVAYDVIVLKDYDKEVSEDNHFYKENGKACPHLIRDPNDDQKTICTQHDKKFFVDSPCDQYGQIEHGNTNCRTGDCILNNENAKFGCDPKLSKHLLKNIKSALGRLE